MPTKYVENSNIWPDDNIFWKVNNLLLTPTGIYQANNLGKRMAGRYPEIKEAKCITTNTNRSIMTAWAMYDGMLKDTPVYFSSINGSTRKNAVNIAVDINNEIIGHKEDSIRHIDNIIGYPYISKIFDNIEVKNIIVKFYDSTGIKGFSAEANFRQNVEAILKHILAIHKQ
jgi:hypothetical protein